jgi:hypothetical protein
VTNLPAPHDIVRMTCLLREHQRWSLVWDPKYYLWRTTVRPRHFERLNQLILVGRMGLEPTTDGL